MGYGEVPSPRLGATFNQLRGRRRARALVFGCKVPAFDWKVTAFDWRVPVSDWRVPVFDWRHFQPVGAPERSASGEPWSRKSLSSSISAGVIPGVISGEDTLPPHCATEPPEGVLPGASVRPANFTLGDARLSPRETAEPPKAAGGAAVPPGAPPDAAESPEPSEPPGPPDSPGAATEPTRASRLASSALDVGGSLPGRLAP